MVSILYRTHKTLSPKHKVNSLYVFDRLARAAKRDVDKHALTADLNQERGNSATFLLKVEGVLDGLLQDTASAGSEPKVSVIPVRVPLTPVGGAGSAVQCVGTRPGCTQHVGVLALAESRFQQPLAFAVPPGGSGLASEPNTHSTLAYSTFAMLGFPQLLTSRRAHWHA